ncbi:MAG: hypothetical protein FWD75_09095 [Propionibacteriaceae bacterium]|nr:hypothetical protein [Propionibacteriaceae bacterium]
MSMIQTVVRHIILVVCVCLLVGCTSDHAGASPTIAPFWRDRIDQILADPSTSAFERQVLSDYAVTDAEFHEAQQLFSQCVADQGWTVVFTDSGYTITATPGGGHDDEFPPASLNQDCQIGSLNYIEPIYRGLRDNPLGLTPAQTIRACYEQHGVPDADGLSEDEFTALLNDSDYHPSTPAGVLCFWDPTGAEGLTQQQADGFEAHKGG